MSLGDLQTTLNLFPFFSGDAVDSSIRNISRLSTSYSNLKNFTQGGFAGSVRVLPVMKAMISNNRAMTMIYVVTSNIANSNTSGGDSDTILFIPGDYGNIRTFIAEISNEGNTVPSSLLIMPSFDASGNIIGFLFRQ
jgi:hypothetical protein